MALVALLATEGADVNTEDEDGDTAMHTALSRQQLATVMSSSEGEGAVLYARVREKTSSAILAYCMVYPRGEIKTYLLTYHLIQNYISFFAQCIILNVRPWTMN